MTAGNGIAHTEESPARNSGRLNGVQLWVALPEAERHRPAVFTGVERVPVLERRGGMIQVFAGETASARSPAPYFSPILGLDVQVHAGEALEFELNPGYEHAALVLGGDCTFENQALAGRTLYYLGSRRASLALRSQAGGRVLLIGGTPFPETILMWWNFVARTPEEIAQARADWEDRRRFGDVPGEHGPRLAAPELVRFARPNPAS